MDIKVIHVLGGFASLMALIILDSVGLEDLSKAAGICMLTDGIGALTGPTFLGNLFYYSIFL